MTGAPYPPVVPGSNAIAVNFKIGVSPIGDIPPFNVWSTIISQYANSPIITTLITNMDSYLDQTVNLDSFFDNVFNINTAQGAGLDVWGRILNISRTVQVPSISYFGFEEALPGSGTFGQYTFYPGGGLTSNYLLSDTSYRILLFAKALSNITDGSIKSINTILRALFPGRGNCYVQDNLNMSLTYVFNFGLLPVEVAIIESTGVLPKSVGVSSSVQQL